MSHPVPPQARFLRFGAFELDVRSGEFRKHGICLLLGEQPLRILLMLLEAPGEVVLRDDIRQRLWPNNTVVEFDHSINAAIKRLRAALGETGERPRYIETVGRRGYRFMGELLASEPSAKAEIPAPEPAGPIDPHDLIGRTILHYKIVEELGAGGSGIVYRGEDLRLGRQVALKFFPGEVAADPAARQRFEHEARAASALNHPNICTVYGVEESGDHLFLVMELIEGMTLQARLAAGPLPRPQAFSFAVQIAGALHAAHRRGLVHRDVKPGNVMLAGARVKVVDFGLAATERRTAEPIGGGGAIQGTPAYMSPEQVDGKEGDSRSDIFSFGLVLYEMATGRRAFEEAGPDRLTAAISQKEPAWGELPAELERVVRKCLAKDPDLRWQSAADLADELEWVAGIPDKVRPASSYRLRVLGRRPALTVAVSSLLLAAGIVVGISIAGQPAIDLSRVRSTPLVMDPGYNSFPAWSPDGRSFAYMHNGILMLRSLETPVPVRVASDSGAMVFSKDGTRLYYTRETAPGQGRKLWTVAATGGDPQQLPAADLGGSYLFDGIVRSPDGSSIIALRQEAGGRIYSLQSSSPPGAPWRPLPCPVFNGPFAAAHLRFSPDGRQLLVSAGPQIWLLAWPPGETRSPRRVFASAKLENGADWMPDNHHVLLRLSPDPDGRGGGMFIGDTATGRIYPVASGGVATGQPSAGPGGKFIVPYYETDSDIAEIPLDGSALRPLVATRRFEGNPDWSHAGNQLAYYTDRDGQGEIWIWSRASNLYRPLVTKSVLPVVANALADPHFSPDDKRILFSTSLGGIWVIPAAGGTPVPVLPESSPSGRSGGDRVGFPAWSPDGQWIAYRRNRGGKLSLEKVRVGDPEHRVTIAESAQGVRPLWSPDGRWITLAKKDGVNLVSPDGSITRHVHGPVSSWTSAGWSRDGKTLYVAVTDGYADPIPSTVWAINPDSGQERVIARYSGVWFGGSPNNSLSPSPDGKALAVTLTKPYIYLWLLEGLSPPQTFWGRTLSWRP